MLCFDQTRAERAGGGRFGTALLPREDNWLYIIYPKEMPGARDRASSPSLWQGGSLAEMRARVDASLAAATHADPGACACPAFT
jgi:hypothetical protein